jgi:hypothetical protein
MKIPLLLGGNFEQECGGQEFETGNKDWPFPLRRVGTLREWELSKRPPLCFRTPNQGWLLRECEPKRSYGEERNNCIGPVPKDLLRILSGS